MTAHVRRSGALTSGLVVAALALTGVVATPAADAAARMPPSVCVTVVNAQGDRVAGTYDGTTGHFVGGATVSAVFARAYNLYVPTPTAKNPDHKDWLRFTAGQTVVSATTDD